MAITYLGNLFSSRTSAIGAFSTLDQHFNLNLRNGPIVTSVWMLGTVWDANTLILPGYTSVLALRSKCIKDTGPILNCVHTGLRETCTLMRYQTVVPPGLISNITMSHSYLTHWRRALKAPGTSVREKSSGSFRGVQ